MGNASPIRCLVTAGPTREYLDPVRFLSNPSSGKMGFALAAAALERGWTVDLVAGPVCLTEPDGAILYPVETAEEMFHQVDALFDACDVLIMTAAVSDFRPVHRSGIKEKKAAAALTIELERTRDILATMAERKVNQTLIGFAAETDDIETYAREKLARKKLDWIVANKVGGPESAFAADINTVAVFGRDGSEHRFGPVPKSELAFDLIRLFCDHLPVSFSSPS